MRLYQQQFLKFFFILECPQPLFSKVVCGLFFIWKTILLGVCYSFGNQCFVNMRITRLFHTCVAREPCKCRSRAVQVLLTSHTSVVREPRKCLSRALHSCVSKWAFARWTKSFCSFSQCQNKVIRRGLCVRMKCCGGRGTFLVGFG